MDVTNATGSHVAVWVPGKEGYQVFETRHGNALGLIPTQAKLLDIAWPLVLTGDSSYLCVWQAPARGQDVKWRCTSKIPMCVERLAFVGMRKAVAAWTSRRVKKVTFWGLFVIGNDLSLSVVRSGSFPSSTTVERASSRVLELSTVPASFLDMWTLETGESVNISSKLALLRMQKRLYVDQSGCDRYGRISVAINITDFLQVEYRQYGELILTNTRTKEKTNFFGSGFAVPASGRLIVERNADDSGWPRIKFTFRIHHIETFTSPKGNFHKMSQQLRENREFRDHVDMLAAVFGDHLSRDVVEDIMLMW